MARLFEKTRLGTLELRNRLVMAPMCMYSCPEQDGRVKDFHVIHYGARALGGVGLVICEATAVNPEGRISLEDAGLWNDDQIEPYSRVVDAIHAGGAKAGIQLAHAGKKSRGTPHPSAPSPIPFSDDYPAPKEMKARDIDQVVHDFQKAASRAVKAGFDILEIHGAHGYLINSFLSPLTNQRHDEYGKDRMLILDQIFAAIREVIPSTTPIILRISASDWAEDGNTPESLARDLSRGVLERHGISGLHVSSGGVVMAPITPYPGYQVGMAHTMGSQLNTKIIAGGMIDCPDLAESIVHEGRADFVFLGRALLRDPNWPLRAANRLNADIDWPRQYLRGKFSP